MCSKIILTSKNSIYLFNHSEEKRKRLEKIREKRLKELEVKRERSQSKEVKRVKTSKDFRHKEESSIIQNKRKQNAKRSKSPLRMENKSRPKTTKSNKATDKEDRLVDRVPIKIKREEAIIANKKIKNNVHYNKHSNKKTIKSAISTICLAGEPNRTCREKVLEIIDKCPCENFVILFKGNLGRYVRNS